MGTGNLKKLKEYNNELLQKGIKPTFQRVKIWEYMSSHRTHPSAEEIFEHLSPLLPTLSRTTVYNTLSVFLEKGLLKTVGIDVAEKRYDIALHPHAHFICSDCRRITDFPLPPLNLKEESYLQNYIISEQELSLSGTCPDCQSKMLKMH